MLLDAFGQALLACLNKKTSNYVLQRDDGYRERQNAKAYFTEYKSWPGYEKRILSFAHGRILDIGAGAGRHSLYLQKMGLEVHAIDISPGAVEVMKKRGTRNVYLMSLNELTNFFPANYFDSILLLGNNLGLTGGPKGIEKLLAVLDKISSPNAKVLASIINPQKTDKAEHLLYQKYNREKKLPPGLIKIKAEYEGDGCPGYVNLFLFSPKELREMLKKTAWKIKKIISGGKHYAFCIKKKR